MRFAERLSDDVLIFDVSGRFPVTLGTGPLRKVVMERLAEGHRKFLFNLEGVPSVDSAGVGSLVAVRARVLADGGQIKLANLTDKVYRALAVTRIVDLFDIYDDEESALAAYAA